MYMEKRERFEKVAVARTNKILNDLRLLKNCSNKNNYQFDNKDVAKIFSAIEAELKKTKNAFLGKSKEEKFTL